MKIANKAVLLRELEKLVGEYDNLQRENSDLERKNSELRQSLSELSRESIEYRYKLERENAAMRDELDEAKLSFAPTYLRELNAECVKLEAQNAKLLAECDALRVDKARLDWLDRQGYNGHDVELRPTWRCWELTSLDLSHTLRDAIDAQSNHE